MPIHLAIKHKASVEVVRLLLEAHPGAVMNKDFVSRGTLTTKTFVCMSSLSYVHKCSCHTDSELWVNVLRHSALHKSKGLIYASDADIGSAMYSCIVVTITCYAIHIHLC